MDDIEKWFQLFLQTFYLDYLPDFAHVFMRSTIKAARASTAKLLDQIETWIDEGKSTTGGTSSLIDALLAEEKSGMSRRAVLENILVFQPDTVQSTPTISVFVCAYLLVYPEYQERIYQEIKAVKGDNDMASINDRPKMPMLDSFIMEVFRVTLKVVTGVFVTMMKDTTLRGYNIPKSTKVSGSINFPFLMQAFLLDFIATFLSENKSRYHPKKKKRHRSLFLLSLKWVF